MMLGISMRGRGDTRPSKAVVPASALPQLRHARAGGHPDAHAEPWRWIPAFAGMTWSQLAMAMSVVVSMVAFGVATAWSANALAQNAGAAAPAAESDKPTAALDPKYHRAVPPATAWDKRQQADSGEAAAPKPSSQADPNATPVDREAAEAAMDERTLTQQLLRTVFALLIVVGLIYLTGKWVLPRLYQVGTARPKGGYLQILERASLDGKNALYLVRAHGGVTMVVGTGEGGVRHVATLPAGSVPDPNSGASPARGSGGLGQGRTLGDDNVTDNGRFAGLVQSAKAAWAKQGEQVKESEREHDQPS